MNDLTINRRYRSAAISFKRIVYCCLVLSAIFLSSVHPVTTHGLEFTTTPSSQTVLEQKEALFFCSVNNQDGVISWHVNDVKVTSKRHNFIVTSNNGRSTLEVLQAKRKDQGLVVCKVSLSEVDEYLLASPPVHLNVIKGRAPDGFPKCTIASTMQVFEVERQMVLLWTVEGDPNPDVLYVRDNAVVKGDDRTRIFSTDEGNYIIQVDRALESDSGKYRCVVTNNLGTAYSPVVQVYVKRRLLPPFFSIKPEDSEVLPGSDVDLPCVAVGSPMPQVKWMNGSQEINEPQEGRNVLELRNVQVSANLTCMALSELGSISHNIYLHVKVSQKGPESLRSANVTSTQATIQWSLVDGDFQNVVFHVTYRSVINGSLVDDIIKRETHQKQMTLTDLKPYTEYQVGVELHCDAGVSRTTLTKFTTLESAPTSPPRRVRASAVNWNSIHVQWDDPIQANGIIKEYKVYFDDNSDDFHPSSSWLHKSTVNKSLAITNLTPNKWYKISVGASTSAGDGPRSEVISILMKEKATPEAPGNLKGEPLTSTSARLSWEHSISSDVTNYVINCRGVRFMNGDEVSGMDTSTNVWSSLNTHVIEGLNPGLVYELKLAAQSTKGTSQPSNVIELEMFEEIPGSSPENLHAEALDSTTIRVTWNQIPKWKRNGKILGYRVLHSTLDPSKNDREEEPDKMEDGVTINVPYPENSWVLRGLPVWSRHKFKVAGYTGVGDGPWSNLVSVRTFEDVPGVPRRLRLLVQSSTSVLVMWHAPLERNGLIQGYQIFCIELDKNEQIVGNQMIKDIDNGLTNEFVLAGLKAGTTYDIQVSAYTRRGDGPRSKPKRVKTTLPAVGPPQNLHLFLHQREPPQVRVTWNPPPKSSVLGASVQGYKVLYQAREASDDNLEEIILGDSAREAVTKPLVSGVEYEFQVMAKSLNEYGPPAMSSFNVPGGGGASSSAPPSSSAPRIISLKRLSPSSAFLSWKPSIQDGVKEEIKEYRVELKERDNPDVEIVTSHSSLTELTLNDLKVDTTYAIQISSCSNSGRCGPWSEAMELRPLHGSGGHSFALHPPTAERISSATAVVKLAGEASEMKNGKYYLVAVHEDLASIQSPPSFSTFQLLKEFTGPPVWICGQFQAYQFPVRFLAGDGSVNQFVNHHQFINHKLNLDNFSYRFFVRLVTANGEEFSSKYSHTIGAHVPNNLKMEELNENSGGVESGRIVIIIVSICSALLLTAAIIMIVVCFKKQTKTFLEKRPRDYKIHRNKADACEVPLNLRGLLDSDGNPYISTMSRSQKVIPIHQLAEKVEDLKRNEREKLRNEYESIDSEKQFTWLTSNLEENRHKNRYANVVAYDHSRVVLQSLGYPGSDYINGNYIDGLTNKRVYIATQGPLPDTFEDFWRMVWECNCSTIVMITKLEERNRIKCDCYWPQHGSEVYGRMQVTLKDILELASYTIRTFTVSVRDFMETREIYQLQFTSWPDHGVPEYPTLLLQFIKRIRTANSIHGGPVAVHCSAGVGRTGTMIAIDISLDHMVQYGTVDILGCVTKLRSQRNYMVQSDDQYQFIYEAILEAASSPGDTEVPADQLSPYIQDLKTVDGKTGQTKLNFEFQKLSIIQYDQLQFHNANLSFNKNKNRNNGILPLDSNRVCLQQIRGVDGSDYINASFVDGYKHQQSYIATQYPLNDTINDFWRMVWEHNCSIIVMLANLVESGIERCNQYWPDDRSMRYQYFVLDPITTINIGQYYVREFKMTDARDGQSRIIYHFQFVDWLHTGHEFSTSGQQFINFIGQVENMRGKVSNGGSIVVHCPTGAGRTGVYVTLSYVLERMRTEGVVNLFETAKILRTQKPFMIQTEEQYSFCYQAASEYLTSFDHYTK